MLMSMKPFYFIEEIMEGSFLNSKQRIQGSELVPSPHHFRTFSSVFFISSHQNRVQWDRCFVLLFSSKSRSCVCERGVGGGVRGAWVGGLINQKCWLEAKKRWYSIYFGRLRSKARRQWEYFILVQLSEMRKVSEKEESGLPVRSQTLRLVIGNFSPPPPRA